MAHKLKVNLHDVAKLANVSVATVSIVLNEKEDSRFSQETINLVKNCAQQLGYIKRPSKKNKNSFNKNVLIICPSVFNQYFSTLIQGIEQAARAEGYHTLVLITYWDTDEELYMFNQLENSFLSGIIYCMPPKDLARVKALSQKIPIVIVGDRSDEIEFNMAEINNYSCGVQMAKHLIELGHKHIAYITTELDSSHPARKRRLDGIQATYANECAQGSVKILERPFTIEEGRDTLEIEYAIGYEITKQAMSDKNITAFVAINDMIAYGVMDALADEGAKVPEDYSVCGFDNLPPSRFNAIQLTTMDHSTIQKGNSAFYLLRDQLEPQGSTIMNNKDSATNSVTHVEYQSNLVIGKTTGKSRNAER